LTLAQARKFVRDRRETKEAAAPLQAADLPLLIAALDRFLEARQAAVKWRALAAPHKRVHKAVRRVFLLQGEQLLEAANARAQEAARALPVGVGLLGPLREASLSQAGWLAEWDTVAADTADLLVEPVQLAAEAGMAAGAAELARQLEIDTGFDLTNPRAVEYLAEHGAEYVTGINETTRERIRTIIKEGAAEGASYTEIANRIGEIFREFAGPANVVSVLLDNVQRSRAELVAITELGNAYERGTRILIDDLVAGGLEMEKQWWTVHDERVSDGCQTNQDAGWIPVSDAFPSGHQQPLRFPGCRCTCLYRRRPRG
jgi:hypothetical protein